MPCSYMKANQQSDFKLVGDGFGDFVSVTEYVNSLFREKRFLLMIIMKVSFVPFGVYH